MGGSVSLIDGHIDEIIESNRCVCCGEIIPEGRMVCPNCLTVELAKEPTAIGKVRKADLFVADRNAGMRYAEIARKYGVSYQRVAQVCASRGVGHFKVYTAAECVYPNLRKWLNENQISRYEFIRRLGLNQHSANHARISEHFRGRTYPRKETIDKFIAVTGLTYEQLFAKEEANG